jgi:hypothetical protein
MAHEANKIKGFADYDNVVGAGTAISTYLGVHMTLLYKGGTHLRRWTTKGEEELRTKETVTKRKLRNKKLRTILNVLK